MPGVLKFVTVFLPVSGLFAIMAYWALFLFRGFSLLELKNQKFQFSLYLVESPGVQASWFAKLTKSRVHIVNYGPSNQKRKITVQPINKNRVKGFGFFEFKECWIQ